VHSTTHCINFNHVQPLSGLSLITKIESLFSYMYNYYVINFKPHFEVTKLVELLECKYNKILKNGKTQWISMLSSSKKFLVEYWTLVVKMSQHCHNSSLGLATKARAYKVMDQEGGSGVTSHAIGNAKSVTAWALTLPSELPFWELESQMDFRFFITRL
jgi:hypothetical protein